MSNAFALSKNNTVIRAVLSKGSMVHGVASTCSYRNKSKTKLDVFFSVI